MITSRIKSLVIYLMMHYNLVDKELSQVEYKKVRNYLKAIYDLVDLIENERYYSDDDILEILKNAII